MVLISHVIARVYLRAQYSSELGVEGKGTEGFGWPADTNNNTGDQSNQQPTSGNAPAAPGSSSPFPSPFATARAGLQQQQPLSAQYYFQIGNYRPHDTNICISTG